MYLCVSSMTVLSKIKSKEELWKLWTKKPGLISSITSLITLLSDETSQSQGKELYMTPQPSQMQLS